MIRSSFIVSAATSLLLATTTASCAPPAPKAPAEATTATAAVTPAQKAVQIAAVANSGPAANADELRARLMALMPQAKIDAVRNSPIPGIYEIQQGTLFGYVTADAKYLISGDLTNLQTGEELTEATRRGAHAAQIAALGDKYIEFAATNTKSPNVVTIFTDVDCGYCRKLHNEIASYNALGISVRYMFFPRSGMGSESWKVAEAVWCSADRKSAFTKAKQGQQVASASCQNPIEAQYNLGGELGLRGTPMMVLPNGEIVNGYVPADRLAARIAASSLPPKT